MVITPAPSDVQSSARPRLRGASVFGVRPGAPLVHTIPATGARPRRFYAERLPAGVTLDEMTGRLSGCVSEPGTYEIRLGVENAAGRDERAWRLLVGEHLALTPPMGWNSWNCWAESVDADKVLRSARAMAASGLADHGWTYVNIDDAWQGQRGGPHNAIQPNEKFPDMAGLAREVHALGLKVGLYSTPFHTSYAGYCGGTSNEADGTWVQPPRENGYYPSGHYFGAHRFETQDARQWAEWGFDYLKYDWHVMDAAQAALMHDALRASGRDLVLSLSNNAPMAEATGLQRSAECWRTTRDIRDCWAVPADDTSGFLGLRQIWRAHAAWAPFTGPGHWPDPDMLVVGKVGWGPRLRPTRLTPEEQRTHVALWCLWSAPLLIGCPLDELDPWTLSLLTNDEVLALNQDALGRQATAVRVEGETEVLAKRLENGDVAVGLFNAGETFTTVEITWLELGLRPDQPCAVRDLWANADLAEARGRWGAGIAPHDHRLLRLTPRA